MKALTVRVPEELNLRFTKFCQKKGYKKGGLILSLIERILDEAEKNPETNEAPIYRPLKKDPLAGIGRLLGKGGGFFNP